jgi:predicted outer membrane protein
MLKIRHLISGVACTLLVTSTLPAQELQREIQQREVPREAQETDNEERKIGAEASAEDAHLTDALAQWLVNGNKAEIELGKLAQQKASSQDVKQFAQKMVKDHTEYLQKLHKFTDEKEQPIAGLERRTEDRTTAQTPPAQKVEERVAGFRGDDHGKHATMEKIGKKAGELHLQMTKELLNKYQGHEFDMAYVGQQIAAHTQMLANLKAMEEHTTGEFATVVKEGVQTTEQHLEHAKELSGKLQKQRGQEQPGQQNRTIERSPTTPPDVEVE